MEKTPRYTQRERNMVLGYAAQYKDVIENKRTDAESNRKKDEVWLQIAKEFNSKVYHQRSAKQLRQLYKNMKLLLKKDLCGEDKGNRSFMDLLNTLSQQESVAQYISEQTDGAGSQTAGNGRHLADDYEDSKPHMYEGMDTDVILIKSETISDNEQTENGMDCMDDDDDDDCPSTKVPEVCLEEDDDELFAADLRQLNHGCFPRMNGNHLANGSNLNGNNNSNNNNNNNNNSNEPLPRASSSPVCSTKTSVSSNGSYMSPGLPKTEITLSSVGNIRVGAFASISKALQNGSNSSNSNSSNNNNNNNNSISCNNNNNNDNNTSNNNTISNGLELTAEQIQQHLLLNGLGLSAVQHPPAHSLQAAINASTSGVGSGSGNGNGNTSTRPTTQMLQLPRLARGHTAGNVLRGGQEATTVTAAAAVAAAAAAAAAAGVAGTNVGSNNVGAGGVQLVLNGHQGNRDKLHGQQAGSTGLSVAAGSFNGYNGLGVTSINAINCAAASNNNMNNSVASSSSSNHNNNSSANNNNLNNLSSLNTSSSSGGGSRGQHNEYMMSLAVEERKRKIELINAQIEYWQTLTKKLDSQSGHFPNPACMCHFPGNGVIGAGVAVGASSAAAASALQTQSSSS